MYSVRYVDLNKGQGVRVGSFTKEKMLKMFQDIMVTILEVTLIPEFDTKERKNVQVRT